MHSSTCLSRASKRTGTNSAAFSRQGCSTLPSNPCDRCCAHGKSAALTAGCESSYKARVTAHAGANGASKATLSKRQLGLWIAGVSVLSSCELPSFAAAPKQVFVAGSTGQTGKQVVKALHAQGIKVVAGVRKESKAQEAGYTKDSGIIVRIADVTQSASKLAQALKGCDAIVCATGGGAMSPFDDRAKKVDNEGTQHLIDAAKSAGVSKFVLVSSLLTNAKEQGQASNPNYIILQLFGGVLEEKLKAEKYLRKSGLEWTVVRPGGLSAEAPEAVGNLVVGKEDTFFAGEGDPGRSISRTTVGQVCAQALLQDKARNKVIEIVASPSAPSKDPQQWFEDL